MLCRGHGFPQSILLLSGQARKNDIPWLMTDGEVCSRAMEFREIPTVVVMYVCQYRSLSGLLPVRLMERGALGVRR